MPTKLSTTVISRISEVPNPVSAQIIRGFYQYTRESNSSEKHMTNALIMTVVNDSMEEKVIETIRKNCKMRMEKSLCQNLKMQ
jgi:hypothetical protein